MAATSKPKIVRYADDEVERIIAQIRSGMSLKEVADATNGLRSAHSIKQFLQYRGHSPTQILWPPERIEQLKAMHKQGLHPDVMAEKLGIRRRKIDYRLKQLGLESNFTRGWNTQDATNTQAGRAFRSRPKRNFQVIPDCAIGITYNTAPPQGCHAVTNEFCTGWEPAEYCGAQIAPGQRLPFCEHHLEWLMVPVQDHGRVREIGE